MSLGRLGIFAFWLGKLLLLVGERVFGEGHDLRVPTDLAAALGLGLGMAGALVAWSRASGELRRVRGRVLLHYALVIVSLVLYAIGVGWPMAFWSEDMLVILRVGWPLLFLLGAFPATLMEMSLHSMAHAEVIEGRRVVDSGRAGLSLGLAFGWLVALNYVADARDVRYDLRTVKDLAPSSTTVEMVRNLTEPVTVTLFFPPANEVGEAVEPYFQALARVNPSLTVDKMDRDVYPRQAKEMKVRSNGTLVFSRGTVRETVRLDEDLSKARRKLKELDKEVQAALSKVGRDQQVAYLSTGHGERSTRPGKDEDEVGLKDLRTVLEALNYEVKRLGLAEGLASEVPADASLVIVAGPTGPMLPAEQEALIRYLDRGGSLLLMLDPEIERDLELTPLLTHLGVEVDLTRLAHDSKFVPLTRGPEDRASLFSNRFMAHDSTRTLAKMSTKMALIFRGTGALKRREGLAEAAVEVKPTVRSLQGTWADVDGDLKPTDGLEARAVFDLVMASQLPAPAGEAPPVEGKPKPGGRAIITSDVDLVGDDLLRLNVGNQQWLVDAIRWLEDEVELSGEVADVEDVPLMHTRDEDKIWFYGTVLGMPLSLLGVAALARRRRRTSRQGVPREGEP